MAETTDIGERKNESTEFPQEALEASCRARVESGAMESELDFWCGAASALRAFLGDDDPALNRVGMRAFMASVGRSITDPDE